MENKRRRHCKVKSGERRALNYVNPASEGRPTCRRRSSSTHGWARLPGASATNDAGTRRRGAGSVAGLCWRTSYPLGLQRAPRSSAQRTLAGGCRHRKPVTDRSSVWKRGGLQRSASQRVRDSGAVMRRDAWANCSTASRAVAEGRSRCRDNGAHNSLPASGSGRPRSQGRPDTCCGPVRT